jgi:hypothetical protein
MNHPTLDTSKSDAVRERMGHYSNPHLVALYHRVQGLRELLTTAKTKILAGMSETPGHGDIWHAGNQINPVMGIIKSPVFTEVAVMALVLETCEASDEYKQAVAEVEPLIAELAEAEAAESERRQEYDAAHAELRAAKEAAEAKALEKVATDPAVTKARTAFEAATARLCGN